ncbi:hypothetical protein H5410_029915 [Solanum commersonii]|uniref:NB-ARC domain-containing protein n=1 Tax=Solanum commersonii TaxID=4109 RepID=A0A9J5YE54_SOLCO|nr:hypothetical protein H5410_029915 [Solanum commersonii]
MAQNDIDNVLDQLRWYKSGGDLARIRIGADVQIDCGLLHVVFRGIPDERKINLNLERLESYLLEFIEELNDSYLDWLGKNLNYVLVFLEFFPPQNKANFEINGIIKQVKIIQKKMRFLGYLYATEINGFVDHEKLEFLETQIQFMANNVEQFCRSFSIDEEDEDFILDKPPYLLCLIVLVELEMKKIFLGELKASKFTQSRTFKDNKLPKGLSHHLQTIEFLLVFLNADVSNHAIDGNWLNDVMEKVGAIAGDVLYIIQKLLPSSINKDDTSKINIWSIQILEKTKDLKAQVETYYKSLKFTPSQFPTAGGLCFLESLLRKLNEISKSKSCLDFMMKPHIGNLEKELSSLTSILEEELSSLSSIFRDYNVLWHIFCSLPSVLKEIKHICTEVTEINPVNDEEIVGFENDTEKMIQYLIRGTNELHVLPIVGMGGQGKTTIVSKVYNNGIIVSYFNVRAWCIISQTYNWRELLQEMFSQVTGSKDKEDKDDILADKLRKHLMGKRYLIVLDDMLSFPDVGNRSRIVATTRLEKVGAYVMHHIDPYILPFLTPEESCQLFQKKVFQQEGCPPELQDVSLAIAKRCKGLPLVDVLVAGIIKRKKTEASWWDVVEKSLLSSHGESEGYSLSVDAKIPVSKLISLWIAEGFVQNIESGRVMEEAAEGYLMDLIHSNVVMVSKRKYNGKVKYCQFQPSEWKESRVSFNYSNELCKFASLRSKTRKTFNQHLRSLIMTNGGLFHISYSWDPFRQCSKLRLVKVLDLSSHKVECLSSATLQPLIHLKYLALHTGLKAIENLESLFVPHWRVLPSFNQFHFLYGVPNSFPLLETLVINGCSELEEIPLSFANILTLKQIKLMYSGNESLEASVERIKEEITENEGCDRLNVIIIKRGIRAEKLGNRVTPFKFQIQIGLEEIRLESWRVGQYKFPTELKGEPSDSEQGHLRCGDFDTSMILYERRKKKNMRGQLVLYVVVAGFFWYCCILWAGYGHGKWAGRLKLFWCWVGYLKIRTKMVGWKEELVRGEMFGEWVAGNIEIIGLKMALKYKSKDLVKKWLSLYYKNLTDLHLIRIDLASN